MAIPKYDEYYRAFLTALADGKVHPIAEIRSILANHFKLTQEDLNQLLPSGKQTVFANRVTWAGVYLAKAGLVEKPSRGKYLLTESGRQALNQTALEIDNSYLMQFPSFAAFMQSAGAVSKEKSSLVQEEIQTGDTPQDTIGSAMERINSALAEDLMQEIMAQSPDFFERLVVQLLLSMGYGGPFEDAGIVTSRTGDGGIDGIIKEDKLGFNQIYIQAKRWAPDTMVSRPEIHKFCGALQDKGASKGLFITTGKFTAGAKDSAQRQHIVLVDGNTLTRLMIEYNIGVSPVQTYTIKQLDTDFFSEDK